MENNIFNTLKDTGLDNLEVIPASSKELNTILKIKGFPKGKISEIYGQEGCGKSTLVYNLILNAQRQSGISILVDTEHKLNIPYMKNMGISLDKLLIIQPKNDRHLIEILEESLNINVNLIAIDSITNLSLPNPTAFLLNIKNIIDKYNICFIITNQIREDIKKHKITTTGGKRLKFYASIRLYLKDVKKLKKGIRDIGIRTKATIIKNTISYSDTTETAIIKILRNKGIMKT